MPAHCAPLLCLYLLLIELLKPSLMCSSLTERLLGAGQNQITRIKHEQRHISDEGFIRSYVKYLSYIHECLPSIYIHPQRL
jgi:hypothetical protein